MSALQTVNIRKGNLGEGDVETHPLLLFSMSALQEAGKGNIMRQMYETEGSSLLVRLPEEVDHPVSDHIRKEIERIMEKSYIRSIVFDFTDTTFMDSSGIGLIMGRYRALGLRQGSLKARNVNAYIEKILRLSGVHRYMEIERKQE